MVRGPEHLLRNAHLLSSKLDPVFSNPVPSCATLKKPVLNKFSELRMSETNNQPTHSHEHDPITAPPLDDAAHLGEVKNNDVVAKAATIAVVGVAAAIVSVELIPGMIIGVC